MVATDSAGPFGIFLENHLLRWWCRHVSGYIAWLPSKNPSDFRTSRMSPFFFRSARAIFSKSSNVSFLKKIVEGAVGTGQDSPPILFCSSKGFFFFRRGERPLFCCNTTRQKWFKFFQRFKLSSSKYYLLKWKGYIERWLDERAICYRLESETWNDELVATAAAADPGRKEKNGCTLLVPAVIYSSRDIDERLWARAIIFKNRFVYLLSCCWNY